MCFIGMEDKIEEIIMLDRPINNIGDDRNVCLKNNYLILIKM